jgi:hypothetical protein
MFKHRISVRVVTLVMALGVAACGQTATPPSSAIPLPSDVVSAPSESPIALPSAVPESSGSPKPAEPVAEPTPRPRLATWSTTPHRIFKGGCDSPVVTVDDAAHFHVASICEGRIRYATSPDGRSWKSSTLPEPADGYDQGVQLAVDGSTLYLAYTHLRPVDQDTCGGRAIQEDAVGVFYRTRELPNGRWSAPTRIGHDSDHLQSLRVVDGEIHETFWADDSTGDVFYASLKGSTFRAIKIPGAEATSLRIGDDGRPRIAYTTGHSLGYAVATGSDRLATTVVFSADDVIIESPVLVLGGGDHAFVSWAAVPGGEGCDGPSPVHEGTWFATDVDGKWTIKRLSKDVGSASLALDVESGRLHATYNDLRGIRYVTRAPDGAWTGSRLDVTADFSGTVLRRDPRTGLLLLVGRLYSDDEGMDGIHAVIAS